MQLHSFVCPLFRRGLIIYFDTCRKLSILLVCACDVESRGLFSFLLNVKIHNTKHTLWYVAAISEEIVHLKEVRCI